MATNKFSPDYHFKYGPEANLSKLDYESGSIIFTEEGQQYVDIKDHRLRVSDVKNEYSEEELTATNLSFQPHGLPTIYIANDTHKVYFYNTRTKKIQPLTVILAEAATNDSAGNNIYNTYYPKTTAETNFTNVNEKITDLYTKVAAIPKYIVRVINGGESLPVKGEEGVVYFLQVEGNSDAVYETYIWINDGSYYIKTASTALDLDTFVTKTEFNDKLTQLNETIDENITTAVQANTDKINTNSGNIQTNADNIAANSVSIETLNSEVLNIKSDVSDLNSSRTALETRLSNIENNQSSTSGSTSNNTAAINSINNQIVSINSDLTNLKDDNTTIKSNINSLTETTNTNTSNISDLSKRVSTNETDIKSVTNTANTNKSNISSLDTKVSTNTSDITTLKSTATSLSDNKVNKSGDTMTGALTLKDGANEGGCDIKFNSVNQCVSFVFS